MVDASLKLQIQQNELNFDSEFDFHQISELTKQTGDQIKSLVEQLMTQSDQTMQDSLSTLSELLQRFFSSSDYAFQYVHFFKGKDQRQEDKQLQKDDELEVLTQKCRIQEEDLESRQNQIENLTKECQNLENTIQDFIFQKLSISQEANELRESIKLSDQNFKELLDHKSQIELSNRQSYELSMQKSLSQIEVQAVQIQNFQAENRELNINLEQQTIENQQLSQKVLKIQKESIEFEVEFKKWEKLFESDQKVKIAKIDKLQCEMEKLQEQLQAKDDEVQTLKQQGQKNSSNTIDLETSPLEFQQDLSSTSLPQDYAQNEQISHDDFLNRTHDYLEIHEFEKNGNFQDFIEEEGESSDLFTTGQRLSTTELPSTMTRFASFVGEQRLQTEADLAQELFVVEQKSSETKPTVNKSSTTPSDIEIIEIRRDPEEEYFRLSVLSLKMQYNERDVDYVFQISSSKLYRRCKKENIPFHQWYNWIEYQLLLIDQEDNTSREKQRQPTTRNNKLIAQDKLLTAQLNRGQVHPEEPQQTQQRVGRETFFQKFARKYWR